MMARDDEVRRKIAQDLRDLVGVYMDDEDENGILNQDLLCALDVDFGSSDDFADPADVYRLAYIIDRPTCRNVADPCDGGAFECSECGEIWELDCGNPGDNHLNFCPNCGAQVVVDSVD